MFRQFLALSAACLLAVNGLVHGLWTQRWSGLTERAVQAADGKLQHIPMKVGNWDGHLVQNDQATMPEEVVGRNVTVRYVHRTTGQVVLVYLACGHTQTMELHTPLECYPANGYRVVIPEARVSPPTAGPEGPEFWAATFSQGESSTPVHLRVFWSWKGAGRWQAPDNPGRTFRRSPFLYKLYAIRQLSAPDEPLEGDPALDCLSSFTHELRNVLDTNP
jgi:Protein of unknown function (DUF3485)